MKCDSITLYWKAAVIHGSPMLTHGQGHEMFATIFVTSLEFFIILFQLQWLYVRPLNSILCIILLKMQSKRKSTEK